MTVVPLFPLSRLDELALRELMKADAAKYLPTLASYRHYPDTVRELCALLPNHDSSLHATLWEGVALPSRVAAAFGLLGNRANATPSLRNVFKAIREAQGPVGEAVRTLLTGKGDGPAALLLRKVVEHRRGEPLEVVDIESDGEPPPEIAAVIAAEKAHKEDDHDDDGNEPAKTGTNAGLTQPDDDDDDRTERAALKAAILELSDAPGANASAIARAHGLLPHTVLRWRNRRDAAAKKAGAQAKETARQRKRAEQFAKQKAAIAARSAKQMEKDAEAERRLAARTARDRRRREKRREHCSEGLDTLPERLSYRDRLALGEP